MENPSTSHSQTYETSPALVSSFPLFLLIQRKCRFSCPRPASACVLAWFSAGFVRTLLLLFSARLPLPLSNVPGWNLPAVAHIRSISRKLSSQVDRYLQSLPPLPYTTFTVSSPHRPTPAWHLNHFSNETAFVGSVNSGRSNAMDAILSQLIHSQDDSLFHSDCISLERPSLMTPAEIVPPFPP